MKNEYIIYNLVLELRNGDYNVIEINNISNIHLDYPNSIETIDAFTMHFSENELKDLIEKNNMVSIEYLKGNFKIISNLKHRLPILTKEDLKTINEINNGEIELETNLKDKLFIYYISFLYSAYSLITLELFLFAIFCDVFVLCINAKIQSSYPFSIAIFAISLNITLPIANFSYSGKTATVFNINVFTFPYNSNSL